jgi:hypothetical protein
MNTRKRIGRDLPNGDYLEIEAEERDGSGGLSAGFAVTCLGWEKRGTWSGRAAARNGREAVYAGADHATILRAAPELAPIVAAHLADPDGVPMHAVANGWYFYSGAAAAYERAQLAAGRDYGYSRLLETSDHERAARALHIPPADLPRDLDHDGFVRFCDSLAETWQAHAAAARAALADMIDSDGLEVTR